MSDTITIKRGYLKDPETDQIFYPITDYESIVGELSIESLEEIESILDNDSTAVGYIKRIDNGASADPRYTWELDPYGGGAKESVMQDGSVITASSSATAGLRKQTDSNTYEYQKISFAAITNDTSTGNNAVSIVLNGNFS